MARLTGLINSKNMLLTQPCSLQGLTVGRCMSKFFCSNPGKTTEVVPAENDRLPSAEPPSYWVPHPSSGIYFPKGQERVMDSIPNDAASLDRTFWLRNTDIRLDHKSHPDN